MGGWNGVGNGLALKLECRYISSFYHYASTLTNTHLNALDICNHIYVPAFT